MAGDPQQHEAAAVRAVRAIGDVIHRGQIVRADDDRDGCVIVSVRYDDLMAAMHCYAECVRLAGEK